MAIDFSIVIPTRNRGELLRRAISSVLHQSYMDYELIVVDDGSDPAVELPKDALDERIRLIRQSVAEGPAAARNAGIKCARGRYIAFLDDDDEYLPNFLLRTRHTLETVTSAGFSWCGAEMVHYNSNNEVISTTMREWPNRFDHHEDMMTETLSIGTGFGVTINSRCFKSIGMFDTRLAFTEDMEFFFRLLDAGFVPVVVQGALIRIHHHGGGRLTDRRYHEARARECGMIGDQYRQFISRHPRVERQLTAHIGWLQSNRDE